MRYKWFLIVIIILGVFFVGCAQETAPGQDENEKGKQKEEQEEKQKTEELVLIDHKDRELRLEEPVDIIVSLMPSATEIVYSLEIEEKLVGVTDFCNYPPQASEKISVGGFSDPNIEEIMALEPGLVLAGSQHRKEVEKLEELGINTLVITPQRFEEIYESINMIATVAGMEGEGENLVMEMQDKLEEIRKKIEPVSEEERVRVYYELYSDPLMSVGKDSVIHEIITYAGGENIFSDLNDEFPQISEEVVVDSDPEVILYPEAHGSEEYIEEKLKERSAWRQISAIKNDRLHGVHNDKFSRPVPRAVQAVEEAAKLFYPELFE